MRKSWFRTLRRYLATLFVAALVLIAVSMSMLRLAVAYAPQLRGEVERILTLALDHPLTLGGMRATWAGRHPRLILEDVRLADEGPLANLEIPELGVDIDLLRSLRTMRLQLAQVAVSGLVVQARYDSDGSLQLTKVGNALVQRSSIDDTGTRDLPARVQLKDAVVQMTDVPTDTTYRLSSVDLELNASKGEYSLAGYIPLPATLGRSVRFRAEWRGGDGTSELSGRVYVDARRLRLSLLSTLLTRLTPVPVMQGAVDAELWADLTAQGLVQLGGNFALSDIALSDKAQNWATVIGQAKGAFQWHQQEAGWDLKVADLVLASKYKVWPSTDLQVKFEQRGGQQSLAFSGGYLHVGDLASTASMLDIVPTELQRQLDLARPNGELFEPRLSLQWNDGELDAYDAYASFRDASMQALGEMPGAAGLTGEVWASQDGGYLQLNSRQGELRFTSLFRDSLPFESLQAEAFWQLGSDGWSLEAPQLLVVNRDGRGQARLRLTGGGEESLFIDLRAHLSEGVSRNSVPRYLPVTIMPKPVVNWLDEAGIDGKVSRADILLFGHVNAFPFTRSDGVLQVQADFHDAKLEYQAGWPMIEAAKGRMFFIDDQMDIRLSGGRIHGAAIAEAQARIAHLGQDPLMINGKLRGSGQQYLDFLSDSPLGDGIREQLDGMRLSGNHNLSLGITVPFNGDQVRVRGSVALEQATYNVPKWDLLLDRLQGQVYFTERGIRADRVSGRYREVPIQLSATTLGHGNREQIRISGHAHASPATLLGEHSLPGVQGQTDWIVQLLLPGFQSKPVKDATLLELTVDSQLVGVAIDLPKPLGKQVSDERMLRLSLPFTEAGKGAVRIHYGDDVQALLGLKEEGFGISRLALQLGPGEPELPREGAIVLGRLEELDLEGWQMPSSRAGSAEAVQLEPMLVDVAIGTTRVSGQRFKETELRLWPAIDGWTLSLSGPDVVGTIAVPVAPDQPIVARLERLRVQLPEMQSTGAEPRLDSPESSNLPAIDVEVVDFILRDQVLGRLDLVTRKTPAGLALEQAQIIGPLVELKGTGGWDRSRSRSQLAMTIDSRNTGRLLDALGYTHAMRDGSLKGSLSVEWQGHLTDFALPSLSGSLDLSLRDGQILKVEPGAGRLFGLLSIGELPRRLSLDFSDLFGKGFSYDRIEAHLQLADGNAYTREFYMAGPSARVELDGRIGLAARDYDQQVTVTPNVSTALPAIGAVAAGPVGAVAGFVTQKLLQKEINRLSRYRYRVAGSWDSPEIEPLVTPKTDGSPATESASSAAEELAVP